MRKYYGFLMLQDGSSYKSIYISKIKKKLKKTVKHQVEINLFLISKPLHSFN